MKPKTLFVTTIAALASTLLVNAADEPKRSAELQVLERFIGTWDVVYTYRPVEGDEVAGKIVSTRAWSLGGTFIRVEDANNLKKPELPEFQMLLTYNPDSKNYPGVTMNGSSRMEITGRWNEKAQTMSFSGTFPDGNKFAATHHFVDPSRAEVSGTVASPDGKLLANLSWSQTRRKN